MTVRRLLSELDSRELSEWRAIYSIEAEERKQADLAARAERGVEEIKAKRRRR